MFNEKLSGRWFIPSANPEYKVFVVERISPHTFYCKIYLNNRFLHGVEVYESTILSNIINSVWEDITNESINGKRV